MFPQNKFCLLNLLIKQQKVNVNYMDESPTSAIMKGHFLQVRFLLELGHSADTRTQNKEKQTALQLCSLVQDKVWRVCLAQTLLEKDGHIGLRDINGLNALHYACLYERLELVELFMKAVDFELNATDRNGNTALFYAVNSGNLAIVRCLVEVLQRYQLTLNKANSKGVTPLMQAWSSDHTNVAQYLRECGADESRKDNFGKSTRSYENEAIERQDYQSKMNAERRRHVRYDDFIGWQEHKKRMKETPLDNKNWREKLNEMYRQSVVHRRQEDSFIPSAHVCDLRNDPRHVFNSMPAQFFEKLLEMKHQTSLEGNAFVGKRRCESAKVKTMSTSNLTSTDSSVQSVTKAGVMRTVNSAREPGWRHNIRNLYNDMEYEVSSSYFGGAKIPSPEELEKLSYFDKSGKFLRFGESPQIPEDIVDAASSVGHRGSKNSPKEMLSNRKDRRNKRISGSSKTTSLLDGVLEKNDSISAFVSLSGGGACKNKKRQDNGSSRPVSRAAFNSVMSRETPSPGS